MDFNQVVIKKDSFCEDDCDTRSILSEFSVISEEDATALDQEEVKSSTKSSQPSDQSTDDKTTEEETADNEIVEEQTPEEQYFEDLSSESLGEGLSWGDEEDAEVKHQLRNKLVNRLNEMLDALSRPFDFEDPEEFSDMLNDFLKLLQKLWLETKMNEAGENRMKELQRSIKNEKDMNIDLNYIINNLRYENNKYHQERTQFLKDVKDIGSLRNDVQREKERNCKLKESEASFQRKIASVRQVCDNVILQETRFFNDRYRTLETNYHKAQREKKEILLKCEVSQKEISLLSLKREQALVEEKQALSEEILAYERTVKKMQADLDDQNSQKTAQDARLQEEAQKHKDEMQKVLQEQSNLRQQQVRINTIAYGNLEEESQKMRDQVQKLQLLMDKQREEHEAARLAHDQQTKSLQKQIEKFREHIDDLQSQLLDKEQREEERLEKTRSIEQGYVKQIEELNRQVQESKQVAKEQTIAKQDSDNVLTTTKGELEKLRDILEEAQDENVTLKNQLHENSQQLNEKTQQLVLEKGELEAVRVKLTHETVARHRVLIELGQITRDYQCLDISRSAAQEKVESLLAEKNRLAEDLEKEHHVSVTINESHTRCEAKLKDLTIEKTDLEASHQSLREQFRQHLTENAKRIEIFEQKIRTLTHHRTSHMADIKFLESALASSTEEQENKCGDLQREMDMRNQKESEANGKKIKDLKNEITFKNARIEALTAEADSWRGKIKAVVDQANKNYNSLHKRLTSRIEELVNQESELQKKSKADDQEKADLKTELAARTTEIAAFEAEVKRVSSAFCERTDRHRECKQKTDEEMCELINQVREMEDKERDRKRKIADLTAQLNDRTSYVHLDFTTQINNQKEEIAKLEAELAKVKPVLKRYQEFVQKISKAGGEHP